MKKIIVTILAVVMMLSLVACGENHTRVERHGTDIYGNEWHEYYIDDVEVTKEMYDEWRLPTEDEKVIDGKLFTRAIPQDVITEDTIPNNVLGK